LHSEHSRCFTSRSFERAIATLSHETARIRQRSTVPHNESYYYTAYVVATVIYVAYAAGLLFRWNRVKARLPGKDE